MRRLTSMLVAGVLAGGTVLAGVASAGASTAKPGTVKPATIKPGTATHRASCTNEGPFFFNAGTPGSRQAAARLWASRRRPQPSWLRALCPGGSPGSSIMPSPEAGREATSC